jgi:hypothetical protein
MPNMLAHRRGEGDYYRSLLRAVDERVEFADNPHRWEGMADVATVGERVVLTYAVRGHYDQNTTPKSERCRQPNLRESLMLEIEIDGKQVTVEDGSTVMDAATKIGAYVPHFCYHKKLSIAANCRMCLVQVEKAPKPLPACATPVTNGMKVWTRSEQAIKAQKGVMEFLLINHPLDCPICDQGGECQLQDLAVGYGGSQSRYEEEKRVVFNKNLGPLVSTDMTRCINCTRCVRFTTEIAGQMELGQAFCKTTERVFHTLPLLKVKRFIKSLNQHYRNADTSEPLHRICI